MAYAIKRIWTLKEGFSVTVSDDTTDEICEDLFVDCFQCREEKINTDLKWDSHNDIKSVQVPVPQYNDRDSVHCIKQFKKNFKTLLEQMAAKHLQRMVFPLDRFTLWPLEVVVKAIKDAVKETVLFENKDQNFLLIIHVLRQDYAQLLSICDALFVDQAILPERSIVSRKQVPTVEIVRGSLDEMMVDVLSCTVSSSLDLTKGAASNALLKSAGTELQHELQREYSKGVEFGEIAIVSGHKLNCTCVYFGIMGPWKREMTETYENEVQYYRASIYDFMMMCLHKANETQFKSIAFPAIGTGNLQYPVDIVADQMFETAQNWIEKAEYLNLKQILFVIYPKDEQALQAFKEAEKDQVAVQNKQKTSCKKEPTIVEKYIDLPETSKPETVVHYFISESLQKIQDQGCSVALTDKKIYLKGRVKDIDVCMEKLKRAVDCVSDLCVDTLSFSSSTKLTDVRKEIDEIEEYMNVCCVVDESRNTVSLYGKSAKDVSTARQSLEKSLTNIEQNSQNFKYPRKDIERVASVGATAKPKHQIESSFSWSTHSKNFKMFITKEKIEVKVYCADILLLPVDCIVNAANVNLAHGGGVAKAIAKAAGKDLTQEGYQFLQSHGRLKVGEACDTGPGKLPYKMVIHAVGPCWSDYAPHSQEKVDSCEVDLYNAVINSLSLAERKSMQTIAIPAISSGIYGCPEEFCCIQYGKALLDYSQLSKCPLKEIHFVDKNEDIVRAIQGAFGVMIPEGNLPSYKKAVYVKKQTARDKKVQKDSSVKQQSFMPKVNKPATQSMYHADIKKDQRQSANAASLAIMYHKIADEKPDGHCKDAFTCVLGPNQKIYIYSANLLTVQKVEMIACAEVPKGTGRGKVTQKLLEMGGEKYKEEKKRAFTPKVKPGDIVFCQAGSTNFKWVAHAIFNPRSSSSNDKDMQKAVNNLYDDIFDGMMTYKCCSLALPLLGTGMGKGDPRICAQELFDSLQMFCSKNKTYRINIHLVHMESEKTKTAVDVLNKILKSQAPGAPPITSHSQRQTNNTHGKPQKRHVATSFGQESNHGVHISGSVNKSGSRYRTSRNSTSSGFDSKGRQKQKSTGYVVYNKNKYMSEEQKLNGSSCYQDEHQLYLQVEDDGDCRGSRKIEAGKLKVFEMDVQKDSYGDDTSESTKSEEREEDDESGHGLSDEESDNGGSTQETCVICMENITDPCKLACGHEFCAECITEQFTYKKACPTCGKVCGIITGDQPYGRMDVNINERASCAGFEDSGRIEITYKFPDGTQEDNHPCPGARYKGITRTAYLPNNRKGRGICEMLKVAFKRKLVFTIGRSRTTGAEGVITWNDIHHKTDPKPNTQFGYPDDTYLDRVTEELEVKGVTVNDIPTIPGPRHRRR